MNTKPLTISILGASGRMGRQVLRLIEADPDLSLGNPVVSLSSESLGQDSGRMVAGRDNQVPFVSELGDASDVVVDFTAETGLLAHLDRCIASGAALVSGATGLPASAMTRLRSAAKSIPVLHAANMSVGVAVLKQLVQTAATALPDADIEIVETHHRFKRDAPSGTALLLAEAARAGRANMDQPFIAGRCGDDAVRAAGEIGINALRGGDVAGEHTVALLLDGERLELTHRASSREIFARGALRLAKRIADRPPGWYQVEDLL